MPDIALIAAGLALTVLVQWTWIARLRRRLEDAREAIDALEAALGVRDEYLGRLRRG